jgi:ATP-dependent RNA helicase RhlE
LRHHVIFGGVSQHSQVQAIRRGVDILVATPGRLLDLMQQRVVSLKDIQYFVLDEADRMLDMGFVHDVKRIITKLPSKRQTLFFSATMPNEIKQLASMLLNDPVKVEVTPPATTVDLIQQAVYYTEKQNKQFLLVHLLKDSSIETALVFTQMKHSADKLCRMLNGAGIRTEAIHGNKAQAARQRALENFKTKRTRVLVATDIAARGIDIDELTHVFNYELPNVPETYVHRIGRTGRAGAKGIAISFCDWSEKIFLSDIQKLTRKTIPVVKAHSFDVPAMHDVVHSPGNSGYGSSSRNGGMRKKQSRAFTQRR